MKFSTKSRYAVMAMVDIAFYNNGLPMKLAFISDRQNIALNYLEQIFVKLRKFGLVKSVKGPGGGYKLAKSAKNIMVADILTAMGQSLHMTRCSKTKEQACIKDNTKCLTHHLWKGLEQHIINYFSKISLEDVVQKNKAFMFLDTANKKEQFG